MQHRISIPAHVLEDLLLHASSASRLVAHLDDSANPEIIRQLGDHVDTVVHELTELLGTPSALTEPDAASLDDREARGGAPMLTSIAGGAP